MKIGSNNNFQGSFGIPQHMKDAMEAHKAGKEEDDRPSLNEEPEPVLHVDYDSNEQEAEEEEQEQEVLRTPLEALEKDFGVKFEDEDFHKILFKGYLEKDVEAVPSIKGSKPLIVTFKSLNGEEYDLVDELLAEDIRDTRMTNDGFTLRRGMWILAIGITKIQGKPVAPTQFQEVGGKKEVDLKATARAKRTVLAKLNAAVINRLTRIHGQITLAINAIIEDPTADYLKKS